MGFERALVSGTAILVPYLALSALLPFGIIYIMGVLRGRNGDKDPLLGAKVISCLLMTVAFQIFLLGTTIFIETLLDGGGGQFGRGMNVDEQQRKTATALCLSGLLVGAYAYYIFRNRASATGDGQVFRQASGLNAITTGLVAVVSLTSFLVAMFNESTFTAVASLFAALVTYGAGHLLCMVPVLHNWQQTDVPISLPNISSEQASPDVVLEPGPDAAE